MVAAEIAKKLCCVLTMLVTEEVKLPGETNVLALVHQDGGFTYNKMFSAGQLEWFASEYHTYIEQEKTKKFHALNRLLGERGLIRDDLLHGRNVVLVSDGLLSNLSLDAAKDFLKSIHIERLIVATPFANVKGVDRMHLAADEIHCLNIVDGVLGINHYYDDNTMPTREEIIRTIETIVLNWR